MTSAAALRGTVAAAFGPDPPHRLGVAVSGGSDSMALLVLLHRLWPDRLHAVTVDHGLRAEAAAEAAEVERHCTSVGIPHVTLHWRDAAGRGNLQDNARRARYGLMAHWALAQGIEQIALGHTQDDQAETVLMQIARRAGVDGLAAMPVRSVRNGITWHRPLLTVARADLRAFLRCEGIGWVDDPGNEDDRFERVKARRALAHLAPLGIDAAALAAVAGNMGRSRTALDAATAALGCDIARTEAGSVVIDRAALATAAPELVRRLLAQALRWVGGGAYAPRQSAQAIVEAAISAGQPATLHGCLVMIGADTVRVAREPAAVATLVTPTDRIWDRRWRLDGPHAPDLRLRALHEDGLAQCDWRSVGLPRAVLLASPSVWRDDTLIAAPLAGFPAGWHARIVADFDMARLSH